MTAHELLLVADDGSLAAPLLDRARAGIEAGEVVCLAVDPETADEVVAALADSRDTGGDTGADTGGDTGLGTLRVLPRPRAEDAPVAVLAASTALAEDAGREGRGVRLLHHAPVFAEHLWWDWARVEAAVRLRLRVTQQTCAYRVGDLRPGQEDLLRATHDLVGEPGRPTAPSRTHLAPDAFVDRHLRSGHGMPTAAPDLELESPDLAQARLAVEEPATARSCDAARVDALLLATTELLTNALRHGRAPVRVRVWGGGGLLQVAVSDGGTGPADPWVGLGPGPAEAPGEGLWLAHHLVGVRHHRGPDGYTAVVSVPC